MTSPQACIPTSCLVIDLVANTTLGQGAPSEIFFAGLLVHWSAQMEPWRRVVGSGAVPDERMALASGQRLMCRGLCPSLLYC